MVLFVHLNGLSHDVIKRLRTFLELVLRCLDGLFWAFDPNFDASGRVLSILTAWYLDMSIRFSPQSIHFSPTTAHERWNLLLSN
jgi:hypothetical protein